MKIMILLMATATMAGPFQYYDIDDIADAEPIFKNLTVFDAYTGCFLDRVPCGPHMEQIKPFVPDLIQTSCVKCSPIFRHNVRRYFEELKKQRPEDYEAMKKKYDSENEYLAALEIAVRDA